MKDDNFLVIDFDSTFIKLEALEEIAKEALINNPKKEEIQKEIEEITDKGMKGEISFSQSLQDRLVLFSANRADIEKVAVKIKENISDSFLENKDFFKKNGKQIFIISGGFKDCIFPVTDEFGIPRENILANEFLFNEQGEISGINEDNFLSQTQGKVKQVKALRLEGTVFAVGDGWTDYEIKREKAADYFLVYTENVSRQNVIELADKKVKNFSEVIKFIEKTDDK
jgi:D-3-phosphoglycerate dehydrogenase